MPDRLSDPDPAEDALCMRNQILQERRAAHGDIRSAGENRAAQYAATHELSTGVDPCGRHGRKYRRTRVFCVRNRFRRADGFCGYLNIGQIRSGLTLVVILLAMITCLGWISEIAISHKSRNPVFSSSGSSARVGS